MTTLTQYRYIEIDDKGRPHIEGTRIRVADVAVMHLFHRESITSIAENLDLLPASVYEAMAYYCDHQAEINKTIFDEGRKSSAYVADNPELVEAIRIR